MDNLKTNSNVVKQNYLKRQDSIDFNADTQVQEHVRGRSQSGYSITDYSNASANSAGTLSKFPEIVPDISTPGSPVPVVKRTLSDNVSQMVAGRSRRDLASQNSVPITKSVTFARQDQINHRAPRICRTPTPYANFDSVDIEETAEGAPPSAENMYPADKYIPSASGNLESR